MDNRNDQSLAELLKNYHHSDGEINLCVQPLIYGYYGVFTNAVLIAIHQEQAAAAAHCKRLSDQQALG
jgi:hypothetical protein